MGRITLALVMSGCLTAGDRKPECTVDYWYETAENLRVVATGNELGRITVVALDRHDNTTSVIGLQDSWTPSVALVLPQPPPVESLIVVVTADSGAVCR